MQVYQRIQNPYMPQGTPDLTNAPNTTAIPFYAPGEIGCAFNDQSTGKSYARLKLDSGATAATPTGAPAVGQIMFWKDRANNLVTNDKRFCDAYTTSNGELNRIAGILPLAATPGNIVDLVIAGKNVSVASNGSGTVGIAVIGDSTASTARVAPLSTATTAPTSQVVGIITTAPANSLVGVDVLLGFVN